MKTYILAVPSGSHSIQYRTLEVDFFVGTRVGWEKVGGGTWVGADAVSVAKICWAIVVDVASLLGVGSTVFVSVGVGVGALAVSVSYMLTAIAVWVAWMSDDGGVAFVPVGTCVGALAVSVSYMLTAIAVWVALIFGELPVVEAARRSQPTIENMQQTNNTPHMRVRVPDAFQMIFILPPVAPNQQSATNLIDRIWLL